jgi:outer membrane protein OmpA-like peptidoglycan-associated protein
MASKRYTLLFALLCLLVSGGFAQQGGYMTGGYNVQDSSVIPKNRSNQHQEYLAGNYAFPAKPRNMWEIGVKGGTFNISGDVPTLVKPINGFGVHVRKALGYVFSLRLEYLYANGYGQHWLTAENYAKNPAWAGNGYQGNKVFYGPSGQVLFSGFKDQIFYNYKTNVQDLSLEGILTLNNIRFHKNKTGIAIYGIAGVGLSGYNVRVNALNGTSGTQVRYNFNGIQSGTYKTRKDVRKAIKALMDDTYETAGETHGQRRILNNSFTIFPTGTVGMGVAIKLAKKWNIALEDRHTFIKTDLLDGQRWQEHAAGDAVLTRDYDSYNFLSLGLNYNLGAKSVEPLYWVNPLDYAYSEIRNPKMMKIPTKPLPDGDGDGVTDQFDNEPNTPQGCPVDSHGVSKDTDGDGVPDCKDKELITPTSCQPVDADGIGKCPDPACCDKVIVDKGCQIGALPSVAFTGKSANLSDDAKAVLSTVAAKMRSNPDCKVVVIGYCSSTKQEQQRSWERVNAIINYLVEKEGISADRFIFRYAEAGGDCNTVDMRAAGNDEDGPNTIPNPHPGLRK